MYFCNKVRHMYTIVYMTDEMRKLTFDVKTPPGIPYPFSDNHHNKGASYERRKKEQGMI